MGTIVEGIDLNMLLEDLAHTKRRLWKVEVQQDCIIKFLHATLPEEDAELIEVLIHNGLSEDPIEIPPGGRAMLAVLRTMAKIAREQDDQRAIQNCWLAKPCRGGEDPINSLVGVSSRAKPAVPRKYRG